VNSITKQKKTRFGQSSEDPGPQILKNRTNALI